MKRLLPLLLLAFLLPVTTNAHDFEVNGIYYNKSGTQATVTYRGTSYSQYSDEYSGAVTIPSSVTYNGTTYAVTAIGSSAFSGCTGLTSVTIPNSVTSISSYAFSQCSGLANLTIGNSVTSISLGAFSGCSGLTNVIIPNSVTSIDMSAFNKCTGLISLTIGSSVKSIKSSSFSGCTSLTSVKVESGNTTYDSRNNCNAIIETASNTLFFGCKNTIIPNTVTSIANAFSGCTGLTSVTIPNSVTSIGNYAFSGCTGLTSVTIPNSVTSIGYHAFSGCAGLTSVKVESGNTVYDSRNNCNAIIETASNSLLVGCKNTNIPNSVTSIGDDAFYGCTDLASATIPNSVTSIGNYAFSGCSGITNVTIPISVTTIGEWAFYDCSSLSRITIPNSVTSIGELAFLECTGLTSVVIGTSITSISYGLFRDCTALTSVTIPNSVTAIGGDAFNGCEGLTSVICNASTPPTMESRSVFSDYTTPTLYVPAASLQAYQSTNYWNQFTKISSIEELQDGKFEVDGIYYQIIDSEAVVTYRGTSYSQYSNEYSGSVTIPPTVVFLGETYPVTSIGERAFCGCTTLTGVSIPNSVISIGNEAFQGCTGLTDVTIPNSVTSFGQYAFFNCTALASVNIGSTVIGLYAFRGCTGLTSLSIGNSVAYIRDGAFFGCIALANLVIPNSVISIGSSAFSSVGLTSIKVESGNTVYDSRNDCNAIIEKASNTLILGCKNTNIPNTVITIGFSAFSGCSALTNVTIPNSVTSIANSAFSNCTGLSSVNIPNSVTSIGNYTFSGCTGLTNIIIPNSVTFIDRYAFSECTGLTNVTIPNSVTTVGYGLFSGCDNLTSINVETGNTIYDSRNNCNAIIETASSTLIAGCKNTTIPSSVTSIGQYAFYKCTGLTSVAIPNSIISIGMYSFSGCRSLKSIVIPNSVTTIGYYAFTSCTGLTKVICRAETPPTLYNYTFSDYTTPTLYVPEASLQAYQTTDYWNRFTTILSIDDLPVETFEVNGIYYYINVDEAVVTYRGTSYSEYSNEYSGTVNIPSTVTHDGVTYPVTTIGEYAFSDCRNLLKVIIPNSLTIIDYGAFYECTGLTSLTLPNSVTTIREAAFYCCTGLMGDLVIPESVTHLGEAVFIDCRGLTSVTILGPITRINDELFYGCTGLTSVTLPNTITFIGDASFEDCTSLTNLVIPNSVDSIIYCAFNGCIALTEIIIPNSVTHIGKHVFSECTGLTSVSIGNSVTEILEDAFGYCTNLTSIVVADDNPVFDSRDHCNGIIETATNTLIVGCKGTVIPGTVTTIGEAAFEGISSMTSVTIPASVALMESDVFDACFGLTSVICKAATPPVMENSSVFPNSTYSNATLYVPSASLQAYRTTDYWNRFTSILPIEDYATAMPTITTELSIGAMTVAATGSGTVVLMVDGVVVDNPCDIPRTDQSRTVRVTATAQEEGKLVSDIATLDVTIPAILPLNTDNYLSMSDTTVVRGATVKIPVRMTNTAEIISFQTDISLAEGLEVVQEDGEYVIDRSGRMTRTHSLSSNRMSNGDIRVLCYSSNYKAFTGNSGDILFYITVRGTGSVEGDQSMTLKNTLFTDHDFNELRAPDATATVTVLPYLKGDANGSGTVTVTDVVVTALRVLEYDPQPFVFESADVNEDGIISVTDVSRIAWMVLNPSQNAPLHAPVLCDNVDRMSGEDITLAPGQSRTVTIALDNEMAYSAFQLDLTLPAGLTAGNFRLTGRAGGHTLDVNTLSSGAIRALCYSPALAAITGHDGALLTFDVTATDITLGQITVDGIECVTDACQTVKLDAFTIGVNPTTSVGEFVSGQSKSVERIDYYNVSGQRVAEPVSGVTIVVTTYSDGSSDVTKLYR